MNRLPVGFPALKYNVLVESEPFPDKGVLYSFPFYMSSLSASGPKGPELFTSQSNF